MPWKMYRFLTVEHEVLVSPYQFDNNIKMFLYVLVCILCLIWAYSQVLYTPKFKWFNDMLLRFNVLNESLSLV